MKRGVYVDGLSEHIVTSAKEAYQVIHSMSVLKYVYCCYCCIEISACNITDVSVARMLLRVIACLCSINILCVVYNYYHETLGYDNGLMS